jgi:glycosyltransferase involved in cell wall biosynthesis
LLETFSRLKGDNICLVLMGYGGMERRIREIAASHRNIFFHPAVPPETLLEYTASADIGIILFENYLSEPLLRFAQQIFRILHGGPAGDYK